MPSQQKRFYLCELNNSSSSKNLELKGSKIIIGRSCNSDFQILRKNVSRNHCIMKQNDQGWIIEDGQSQNGTYVNGMRIREPLPLKSGDVIQLGPPKQVPQKYLFCDCHPDEDIHIIRAKAAEHVGEDQENGTNDYNLESGQDNSREGISARTSIYSQRHKENTSVARNTRSKRKRSDIGDTNAEYLTGGQLKRVSAALVDNVHTVVDSEEVKSVLKKRVVSKKCDDKNNPKIPSTSIQCSQNSDETVQNNSDSDKGNSQSLLDVDSNFFQLDDDSFPFSQALEESYSEVKSSDTNAEGDVFQAGPSKLNTSAESVESTKVQDLQKCIDDLNEKLNEEKRIRMMMYTDKQKERENMKQEIASEVYSKIEDELTCNICTELMLKPIVLDCSHTFCDFCITEWKKKKKQCPICRNPIKTQTPVLALERVIEKSVENMSPNSKQRRTDLLKERETHQKKTTRPPTRRRSSRLTERPIRRRIQSPVPDSLSGIELLDDYFSGDEIVLQLEESDDSDENDDDSTVEGYGYYPGYGRCFNCGRRGHWANGCPNM